MPALARTYSIYNNVGLALQVGFDRHGKTGESGWVWVGSIGLQVKWVTSQKRVTLSRLKTGSGQSGCGLGRVDPYFYKNFFLIKKTTCICYLESHATNYLM